MHVNKQVSHEDESGPREVRMHQKESSDRPGDPELFIRLAFASDPKKGVELLFRRYHRPLCSHGVRFVYSREIAEDIVADVFYEFCRNKTYQSFTGSYSAYFFQAVRNRAYNYMKWEFSRQESLDNLPPQTASQLDGPDRILQYDELYHQVESIIQQLPPKCKQVLVMSRFDGRKPAEIAQEMKISVRTVEGHIRHALQVLRTALSKKE